VGGRAPTSCSPAPRRSKRWSNWDPCASCAGQKRTKIYEGELRIGMGTSSISGTAGQRGQRALPWGSQATSHQPAAPRPQHPHTPAAAAVGPDDDPAVVRPRISQQRTQVIGEELRHAVICRQLRRRLRKRLVKAAEEGRGGQGRPGQGRAGLEAREGWQSTLQQLSSSATQQPLQRPIATHR
jgi:hypothetical protein